MSNKVYDLIKVERKRRGLPNIYWSREMARLAQSQADYCAGVRRLVHSDRYAFSGGENLWGGRGNPNPVGAVRSWLHSGAGHREYLLSSRITKAGVGVARRNGFTCVAFAFSDQPPSYPDCPYYKSVIQRVKPLRLNFPKLRLGGSGMLRIPISILIGLCGLWGVVLGAHGLYVYFSRLELLFGADAEMLFMSFAVPGRLGDTVAWMSVKGLQSWFIPVAVFVGGWVAVSWSGLWDKLSSLLSKSKLW